MTWFRRTDISPKVFSHMENDAEHWIMAAKWIFAPAGRMVPAVVPGMV